MQPELFIFDLDGTLFRGQEPIPHAVETVRECRRRNAHVRFLTNNSSTTRALLTEKLNRLGFEAVEAEVYSSAMGAARYLRSNNIASAFVLGEDGLIETLSEANIEVDAERPEAVVVGICRHLTYAWLDQALQSLLQGARFLATNRDATYPLEGGKLQPGAGAMVAALEASSGQVPIVIGKPEPFLIEWILKEAKVQPAAALVVGDRLETDIEAGRRAGCATYLTLTGVCAIASDGQRSGADLRGILD